MDIISYVKAKKALANSTSNFSNMFYNSNAPTSINSPGFDYKLQVWRVNSSLPGGWSVFSSFSNSYQVIPVIQGHKYYVRYEIDPSSVGLLSERVRMIYEDNTVTDVGSRSIIPPNYVTSQIITAQKTANANIVAVTNTAGTIVRKNQLMVDLTNIFGQGNEPTKEEFEEILTMFENKWFDQTTPSNTVQDIFIKDYFTFKKFSGERKLPNTMFQFETRNLEKEVIYYDIEKKIVYAVDRYLENRDKKNLYASYNYGKSWEHVYTADFGIQDMVTLKSGYHIMFTTNIRVRRVAPDFSSYNEFPELMRRPLNSTFGLADNGNGVIMFCQYHSAVETYNILKSTDDGLTWTVALEGSMVKHWHSLQIDPYTGHWWACGGDNGEECRIIKSEDDGLTWQVMASGLQEHRAVGLVFTENEVIWGMDTAGGAIPKVMKANKSNFVPVAVGEVPLGTTTLGVAKTIDGLVFGWTRVEPNSSQQETAVLWVSDGTTVKTVQKFAIDPTQTFFSAGFTHGSMIDDENRWFGNGDYTVMNGSLGMILPLGLL